MLFRESADRTVAIPQPSHAWLAGQVARAWGNADFGAIEPFEEVCLGAEQHDVGWLVWEQAPTLNSKTGRPHSFRELDVAAHTKVWSMGTTMALSLGRYPALLVSLHGSNLYSAFDFAAADAAAGTVVRAFLKEQAEIQHRLVAQLMTERRYGDVAAPEIVERNRLLVRTADRLSIAVCTALADVIVRSERNDEGWVRDVPTARGRTDLRLRATDAGFTRFTLDPWPFAASSVSLTCEGYELPPTPFDDEAAMRAALREARPVLVAAELRPA